MTHAPINKGAQSIILFIFLFKERNMIRSKIIGIGSYVPETVWTNDDLSKIMETSDEWIKQRTGIEQRHWVKPEEQGCTDLALIACERAIENAGIKKEELDCIVYATLSPDHEFPGNGCFLQAKLGVPGIPAYDIRQQCAGFIYGMEMVNCLIQSGQYKNVLLIGAEVHSLGLDKSTRGRDVGVLFGDGAGAVIVQATDENDSSYILGTEVHADGSFAKELWIEGPSNAATKYGARITKEMIDDGLIYAKMNGKAVFMNAVRRMVEVTASLCEKHQVKSEDIDLFVFHQANLRINDKVAEMMGVDQSKVFNTIQKFANTTAATIPLTLDEARKAGRLEKGMLVCSAAFGSGFVWGSALYRW